MTLPQILTPNRKRNKTLFDVTIEKVEFQTTRKEFEEILPWLFFH
jgi:arginyl-tRNA synthetase